MSSVWEKLSKIDVSEHTEKKGDLTYLSWAWAWGIVKENYPSASFQKNLFDGTNGMRPYMVDSEGYAFVSVTVRISGEEQTEILPVLDYRNKAVKNPDSFSVNTSLQRCLAKCCAMHGLGHYIYAGEDLPQGVEPTVTVEDNKGNKEEVEGLQLVAEVFNKFIPECKTVEELRGFWGINKSAIKILENGDKKLYDDVFENFKAHKETLEPSGEAA